MEKTEFVVPRKGMGRPDFSEKVSGIAKGYTYPSFWPAENERWKIFLASYPTDLELEAGKSAKFIDTETNLPTAYTSPKGWHARYAAAKCTFNQNMKIVVLFEPGLPFSLPPITFFPPTQDIFIHNEQIAYLDTRYRDPLALDEHWIDFIITNTSEASATGFAEIALIMQKIGTVEMKEKKVRCLKCSHINIVPLKQTKIICQKCRNKFAVPFYGQEIV